MLRPCASVSFYVTPEAVRKERCVCLPELRRTGAPTRKIAGPFLPGASCRRNPDRKDSPWCSTPWDLRALRVSVVSWRSGGGRCWLQAISRVHCLSPWPWLDAIALEGGAAASLAGAPVLRSTEARPWTARQPARSLEPGSSSPTSPTNNRALRYWATPSLLCP